MTPHIIKQDFMMNNQNKPIQEQYRNVSWLQVLAFGIEGVSTKETSQSQQITNSVFVVLP